MLHMMKLFQYKDVQLVIQKYMHIIMDYKFNLNKFNFNNNKNIKNKILNMNNIKKILQYLKIKYNKLIIISVNVIIKIVLGLLKK